LSERHERPILRLIHSETSFSPTSLAYWRGRPIGDILESLNDPSHPRYSSLEVRADGAVLNGNTRLFVLREKGYDIDTLDWAPPR
jgi:hypothetical protein